MAQSSEPMQLCPALKEWVSVHLTEDFKKALHLTKEESKNDPPKEPFRSLYASRELLASAKTKLESCSDELKAHEDFIVLSSCIQLELGLNYINCEELSAGEKLLETCPRDLDGIASKVKTASVSIQALNQLGVLWGNRNEQQKALEFLLKAKAVYESHISLPPPITDSQWLLGVDVSEEEREKVFENFHTLTLFYLAQVYGNLKQPKLSAQYCQTTLSRQLETNTYDAVEWSLNCATLSQYFMSVENFGQSRHCLAAASRVLQQFQASGCGLVVSEATGEGEQSDSRMEEKLLQTKADISRCWTKYCISLLTSSQSHQEELEGSEEERPKIKHKQFRFDSLDVADTELSVPSDFVENYEKAKLVFLFCQKHVDISKKFYSLEEHATEHVKIIQDYSNAYKLLAHFDTLSDMKCRMHKRRIDMLIALQEELNPRYYLDEHREIMIEVATAQSDMADLKILSASDSPTPHAVGKINKLLQSSIRTFEQFILSFHDSRTKALPDSIDQDHLRPILCAKLNIARLFSKFISPDPAAEKFNLQKSLEHYKWLVEYCERHKEEAEKAFSSEFALCKEMVELLPLRMQL